MSMLNKYEKLPSRAPTVGALLGSSVPTNTMEEAAKTPGNDLLSMLGGRVQLQYALAQAACCGVYTVRPDIIWQ